MTTDDPTVFASARAPTRLAHARTWLGERPEGAEVLVVGETLHAAHDLVLRAAGARGPGRATMGWRRITLPLLVRELAPLRLAADGRAAGSSLSRDAIVARALATMDSSALGRLGPVSDTPGFPRAVGAALDELRMAGVDPDELADRDPDLAALARAVRSAWSEAGLADRADMLAAAAEVAAASDVRHYLLGLPVLLLDVAVRSLAEARFVAALLEQAPKTLLTIPFGDWRTTNLLTAAGVTIEEAAFERTERDAPEAPSNAARRLQDHLFESVPEVAGEDDSLTIFSAPGEGRECVEITRRLFAAAAADTRFDQCAILLRQPEDYRPHLGEALSRAGIPAYFARGARRPDPAGRAFVALLRCRAENYSALRFAEYLSIGEVPDAAPDGGPPAAADPESRWEAPDDEAQAEQLDLLGGVGTAAEAEATDLPGGDSAPAADLDAPVRARTLRVPRRWERLLVEAAVVGGLDRWSRRLEGLRAELELQRAGLLAEDPDDTRVERIDRTLTDLGTLEGYALPLLDALASLPDQAPWADWLTALGELASRALRDPARVSAVLSELAPMGPVGPVDLEEVLRVIGPRLNEVTDRPEGNRFGRVFVGSIDAARGMSFDLVFVPGMAERLFPPKIAEDPILLDETREGLGGETRLLETNRDRVAAERLALRMATGAVRNEVVLSYPRIEAAKARPRVPSFYALEAIRAAEGELPTFEALAKRAEDVVEARIGWPAPQDATRAIDEAEYDLAVLDDLGLRGDQAVRAAGHLLQSNPHLARALRFRAYRWEVKGWTWADGLMELTEGARAALATQSPEARSFSATALQHFAACPYRFYLQALQRLQPRERPVGIESLDPLQRGSLVHQVQFELLTRLQRESTEGRPLLPVTADNLAEVRATLDEVLDKVAADFEDHLVPAIDRVWRDGVESIRQDLREWLLRESRDPTPFEPWRFELSFGLPTDPNRDERSVAEPVDLGIGLRLRGAIDLLERTPDGVLRVTDHKTGRHRAKKGAIIQGGELLQPVLYGLAAKALFPDLHVESGRLYYCTTAGEYRSHTVEINDHTTQAARSLAEVIRGAFESGRFPALPRKDACRWCDYSDVCGPDEERRVRRKPKAVELKRLRDYP